MEKGLKHQNITGICIVQNNIIQHEINDIIWYLGLLFILIYRGEVYMSITRTWEKKRFLSLKYAINSQSTTSLMR